MADLSRLSAAERQALLLLAQGHTAKSAATALGTTEGAVNERLREARRKTGVGSSRELARLVSGPQENRDKNIGMAEASAPSETVVATRARWPVLMGVLSMIVLAAAVGAFAALSIARHPAPPPPPTPGVPPRVVAVSPAVGAEVAAGTIAVTVTFDQPMRASWSFVMRDPASYPNCGKTPAQSKDGRSFTLACRVEAGKAYWIGFNNARFQNFRSVDGVPATPAMLRFSAK
jgi:DNA-binding CsgD family transcriptional regulator